MAPAPLRLVVLGDSTAFTDDVGPQLPTHPTLYPNVLARQLEAALDRPVEVTVLARAGMTVHEAFRTVTKDRHAQFDVLAGADAVVVAIGGIDHAPGGVPAVVDAVVPHLRPPRLRRWIRARLHALYPWMVRATRWRLRRTPAAQFELLFDRLLLVVRGLTAGAAMVVAGPTSHRATFYAGRHPLHPDAESEQLAVAARHGVTGIPIWRLVEPHADRLNPDGIHWPAEAHAAVGSALAAVLLPQLRGEVARPPRPGNCENASVRPGS